MHGKEGREVACLFQICACAAETAVHTFSIASSCKDQSQTYRVKVASRHNRQRTTDGPYTGICKGCVAFQKSVSAAEIQCILSIWRPLHQPITDMQRSFCESSVPSHLLASSRGLRIAATMSKETGKKLRAFQPYCFLPQSSVNDLQKEIADLRKKVTDFVETAGSTARKDRTTESRLSVLDAGEEIWHPIVDDRFIKRTVMSLRHCDPIEPGRGLRFEMKGKLHSKSVQYVFLNDFSLQQVNMNSLGSIILRWSYTFSCASLGMTTALSPEHMSRPSTM